MLGVFGAVLGFKKNGKGKTAFVTSVSKAPRIFHRQTWEGWLTRELCPFSPQRRKKSTLVRLFSSFANVQGNVDSVSHPHTRAASSKDTQQLCLLEGREKEIERYCFAPLDNHTLEKAKETNTNHKKQKLVKRKEKSCLLCLRSWRTCPATQKDDKIKQKENN